MVSDRKVVFWVLPEDFFVSLKGRLFFVLEVQTPIKSWKSWFFIKQYHFTYCFFLVAWHVLRSKTFFFHFMFVILAHFEKPKKHKWNDTYFFHEFSCFFWLPKPKNQTPSRGNKKTEKKWGKTKKQLFYLKQYFLFQQMFFFFFSKFFLVFSRGCLFLFFVLEVPKPRKLMEKVSFYQKHHFTDLLVFFTCFEIKNNLFPFVFFVCSY